MPRRERMNSSRGGGADPLPQRPTHWDLGALVARLKARLRLADTVQTATTVGGGAFSDNAQVGQGFGGLVADVGEGLPCPFVLLDHRVTPLSKARSWLTSNTHE